MRRAAPSAPPSTVARVAAGALLGAAALLAHAQAAAPTVSLGGRLGAQRALLVVDGQPRVVALGERVAGVRLLRLDGARAEVEFQGKRWTVDERGGSQRVGGAAAGAAAASSAAAPTAAGAATIAMDEAGQAFADGQLNGRTVRMLVDTGASTVTLSQSQARAIGLDFTRGRPAVVQTANGPVPVHAVTLDSVRVQGAQRRGVPAVVVPSDLPAVLLGASFLNHFALRRDAQTLRLEPLAGGAAR